MGFFDGLTEALAPHSEKLRQDMLFHGTAIHGKLHAIERAIFDLGRGDIGNKWQRFSVQRKFAEAEDFEVGTCPVNEMWLIQAISSDGVQEKSPAYVVLANGILLESVVKEGLGFEGVGGNQVVMPGERLSITARASGNLNCVITVIRRQYPTTPTMTDMGRDADRYSPRSTHDPARDEITSRTGQFVEQPSELAPTEGRTG